MVRTRLRLAATLAVVVLALTGFQTSSGGHGGGSGKSGSKSGKSRSGGGDGGGGGCSSSKKKNDDYTDTTDGTGNGSGGSNGSTYTPSPTTGPGSGIEVEVVDCVEPAQKKRKGKPARKADTTATVRVTAPDGEAGRYRIVLEFERADGSPADRGEVLVDLTGGGSRLYDVAMRTPGSVGQVKHCVVDAVTPQSASAAPAPTASGTPSSSS